MKISESISEILNFLETKEGHKIELGEEAISKLEQSIQTQSKGILILSYFGGILAVLFFLGFFFLADLKSIPGLIVFGTIFLFAALLLGRVHETTIQDTISFCLFLIGSFFWGFALEELFPSANASFVLGISLSLFTILVVRSYVLTFLCIQIFHVSLMFLLEMNNLYIYEPFYLSIISFFLTFLFLEEAFLLSSSKKFSSPLSALQAGTIFLVFASNLFLSSKRYFGQSLELTWIVSTANLLSIGYILNNFSKRFQITKIQQKLFLFVSPLILLLPTIQEPGVSGSILLILCTFWANHKLGIGVGILSLLCFLSKFYYDLEMTLLLKSILLFSTGMIFLIYFFLTNRFWKFNGKV